MLMFRESFSVWANTIGYGNEGERLSHADCA